MRNGPGRLILIYRNGGKSRNFRIVCVQLTGQGHVHLKNLQIAKGLYDCLKNLDDRKNAKEFQRLAGVIIKREIKQMRGIFKKASAPRKRNK